MKAQEHGRRRRRISESVAHSGQMVPFTDGATGSSAKGQSYNLILKSPLPKTVTTLGRRRPGLDPSVRMGLAEPSDLSTAD